jgi:hypothetical protein
MMIWAAYKVTHGYHENHDLWQDQAIILCFIDMCLIFTNRVICQSLVGNFMISDLRDYL